jgi:hypothetical protein
MPDDISGFAQGIADVFVSSRLGEAELLLAFFVALFLLSFLLRGRDPDYVHRKDLNHHHM